MDAAFKLAAIRMPRHRVLGLRLEPLTLGHLFLLHRYESSFVTGEPTTLGDLTLSAFLCSEPWQKSERNVNAWWFNRFSKLWAWASRKRDFVAEYDVFSTYITEGMQSPAFNRTTNGTPNAVGSPRHFAILASLMSQFHMTKAEAMDCTIVEAQSLLACVGEMRGAIQLRTDEQRSHWAAVRGEARN